MCKGAECDDGDCAGTSDVLAQMEWEEGGRPCGRKAGALGSV